MPTQNHTYCLTALYPLHPKPYTLKSHTFSAKERDTETGLSYYGSRYYSSDLSIWLSMDPMASKYPSLSPYVYCANNPIKLVDPNGEEIGDYYDAYGKYLGTDGNEDNNIYIVTDAKSQKTIKQNEKNHSITKSSNVNIDVSTTIDVLKETCNVYNRTEKNGGDKEEASTFSNAGKLTQYPTGSNTIDIAPEGSTSIHSHLLNNVPCNDGSIGCIQTPTDFSESDYSTFNGYALNVVVGKSNCNQNIPGCDRQPEAAFYNRSKFVLTIDLNSIMKIINHHQNHH